MDADKIAWDKVAGLLPVIIQHYQNGEVLMLGYMNQAALNQTLETALVTFYSRTKQRLWTKGETSGDFLNVVQCRLDCDYDTLLILVNPVGNTCHLGHSSCFHPVAALVHTNG